MHLAHPRTARDDGRSRPEHLRGTAEPPGRPLRIPCRIGISAGPLPGALTASGQHGHRPFPRSGEAVMRSPLKLPPITATLVAASLGAAVSATLPPAKY